jgi:hypothetical protein
MLVVVLLLDRCYTTGSTRPSSAPEIDGSGTEVSCFIYMENQSAIHSGPLSSLHTHSRKTLNKLTYYLLKFTT